MKTSAAVLLFLFLSATMGWASNCQTRVDSILHKSTETKIQHCLAEDEPQPAEQPKGPEVIISDTYSVVYPKQKQKQAPTPKETKIYKPVEVQALYMDRDTYPSFRNDIFPQVNTQEADEAAMDALYKQRGEKGYTKPKVTKPAKPAKAVKTVPAKTPTAQISQAEQLQNDPLAPLPDDTYPQGFNDDGILGPSGFGYNATDPAFQQ